MEKTLNPFNRKTVTQSALIGVLASQLMTSSAFAAELTPLVVTAGRIAENPANISSDVTVISRDNIESSQATTVAEILRGQAGLDVSASGGAGKATSVFIRGGNSGHTLVLIDGVRVGSATLGSFNWGNLAAADIERIEIVRGPQSSLYGADAMAGVIQVFTRKGQSGLQTELSAETGSYGTKTYGLSVRGASEAGTSYAFSAENFDTDGFSVAAKGTEADPSKRTTLSAKLGFTSGKMEADFSVRNVDATTSADGYDPVTFAFGDLLQYENKHQQNVSSFKLTDHVSQRFDSSVQWSRSTDDLQTSYGVDPANTSYNTDYKTTIDQLTWQNSYALDRSTILLGYENHKYAGVSKSGGMDKTITQNALFASMAMEAEHSDWNASVRSDNNSASSDETTYKLGMALHPSAHFSLTANYGTGFKAPTINDLYFPNDGFGTSGNPNLKAETSESWDVGMVYQTQAVKLSAVGFKQIYDNLIVWQCNPVTWACSPVNVARAVTQGSELSAAYTHAWGFINANWTILDATDDKTGNWLARRAQRSGSVTVGTDVGGLHAELQTALVGKRYDDAKNTKVLDAYRKTDLRLSYAFNQDWKLKVRVENLNDAIYEEVAGYGVAGRSTYTGISATF